MYVVYNKTISAVNDRQLTDSNLRGINQQNEKKHKCHVHVESHYQRQVLSSG